MLEFLSFRTFSSVWYWITVAIIWAAVGHRPMGVPFDMVWRARRDGAEAQSALAAVAGALAKRLVVIMARGGVLVVAFASALLTALLVLSMIYGLELAQGVLLIVMPLFFVSWLSIRTARTINAGGDPERHLRRLRTATQGVGILSLFVTAFWGMYVNFMSSVL
jgi:hypothetical protein